MKSKLNPRRIDVTGFFRLAEYNKSMVRIKRVYEPSTDADGFRILVDRLWPRGLSKERAAIDMWFKEIAPSPELRAWFGHEPERFAEFRQRYTKELEKNPACKQFLQLLTAHKTATLLYGARNETVNHAVILLDFYKAKNQDR